MFKIPVATGIANAAARRTGTQGEVTHQAEAADCSRQTVSDQARKVPAAVAAQHAGGPTHAERLEQNRHLRREHARLWDALAPTIAFPEDQQRQCAVTACAMGLSLNQVLALLGLILGQPACPGRTTLHRGIQAAGRAAGRVRKHLDARCQAWVLVGGRDEIFFHRRPVLVGVEPARRTWSLGPKADDRSGAPWAQAWRDWSALSYVPADAGTGLQAGSAAVHQERHADGAAAWENGRDGFPTAQEAQRVLRLGWNRGERLRGQAEAADRRVEPAQRQGRDARGGAVAARHAWRKGEAAFAQYERGEAAWKMAHAALSVLGPEGQLNDRGWARGQSAWARAGRSGRAWSQVRNFLPAGTALTFLDRLHRESEAAVPAADLRIEWVHLGGLRRPRPRSSPAGARAGAGPVAPLVQQVVCQKLGANGGVWYRAVARVVRPAVRARGAVGCRNRVLRRHQCRHRTWRQGLRDLKRLYWNCRAFRGGKRRGRCPYEHLGLDLPSSAFWSLLQGELVTAIAEEKAQGKAKLKVKAEARAA